MSESHPDLDRRLQQSLSSLPTPRLRTGFDRRLRTRLEARRATDPGKRLRLLLLGYWAATGIGSGAIVWRLSDRLGAGAAWPLISSATAVLLVVGALSYLLTSPRLSGPGAR